MDTFLKNVASALITYSVHYVSVKSYNSLCVPDGISGYFSGLVTMGSPICQIGMKLMKHTEVSYSTICIMGISRIIIDYITPIAHQEDKTA
ncbi:hypothetical protein EBR66_06110 [bacterium]|jgi:hypothetical protein|nr:hypothetical protein [bacterium]